MFELAKIDFFELLSEVFKVPEALEENSFCKREISKNDSYVRYYSVIMSNVINLNERKIMTGEENGTNFSSIYGLPSPSNYKKSIFEVYYLKSEPHLVRMKILTKILSNGKEMPNRLYVQITDSLNLIYNAITRECSYSIKGSDFKELNLNTIKHTKAYLKTNAFAKTGYLLMRNNFNQFIVTDSKLDYVKTFISDSDDEVKFDFSKKDFSRITNPGAMYRHCTGYRRVTKQLMSLSLRDAIIFSQYIEENEQQKFFDAIEQQIENVRKNVTFSPSRSVVKDLIILFYMKKFGDETYDFQTLKDYVNLIKQTGEKLNLNFTSVKRLKDEHDRLSKLQRLAKIPDVKAHDMYINLLESTEKLEVELIDNKERLAEESDVMHHCVYSYHDRINAGTCAIFSLKEKENPKNRWTMQVNGFESLQPVKEGSEELIKTYSYSAVQIKGYHNAQPPEWVQEEAKMLIRKANKGKIEAETKGYSYGF